MREFASLKVRGEAVRQLLLQRTQYQGRLARYLRARGYGRFYEAYLTGSIERLRAASLGRSYGRDLAAEYESIAPYLPPANRILDIGCGLGGIDVLLWRHYDDARLGLWMLDRNVMDTTPRYGFQPKASAYANLDHTARFLADNGVPRESVTLVDADHDPWPEVRFDVVISLVSWGFHYPVSEYAGKVASSLAPGAVVLLDVRKETEGVAELSRLFSSVEVVADFEKHQRICASAPR